MRRIVAWLLAVLLPLGPWAGRAQASSWSMPEAVWDQISVALVSGEESPVPLAWQISVREDDLHLQEGLDPAVRNFLLLSTDSSAASDNRGRTELMLLCSVNLRSGEVRLAALPEDATLTLEGVPGEVRLKYVHCFGGPLLTIQRVNAALALNVTRYMCVHEASFIHALDLIGGVRLTLADNEAEALDLPAGEALLDGEHALRFARLRRTGDGWERPRRLLEALISQVLHGGLDQAFSLAEALLPAIDTNLTTGDVMELLFSLLLRAAPGKVETLALSADQWPEGAAWCRRMLYGLD